MNTFFFDDVQYPEGLFGGKDFFNPIIYSTEEREVGVWIDNKPLYAKSFTLSSQITVSASSWTNTDLSLSDVEKFVNGYAISDDGTFQGSVVVNKSNDVIQLQSTRSSASYVKYLTVFYTKTTDVAGSASYTTLGVPAHHYDSNEKIVGTWFGETLYEKTFNGLATNTNGDNWVNIGGIDATTWKDAVKVEIYCNSSDVNNKLTRIALGELRVFNGNVQVTTSVSYNREINVATIQYTKTS